MADLRRRKPDDDSGKTAADDDVFSASKPERSSGDGANGSDDEHLHHTKPSSGLTTADSSDHVNKHFIYSQFTCILRWFICLHKRFAEKTLQYVYAVSQCTFIWSQFIEKSMVFFHKFRRFIWQNEWFAI